MIGYAYDTEEISDLFFYILGFAYIIHIHPYHHVYIANIFTWTSVRCRRGGWECQRCRILQSGLHLPMSQRRKNASDHKEMAVSWIFSVYRKHMKACSQCLRCFRILPHFMRHPFEPSLPMYGLVMGGWQNLSNVSSIEPCGFHMFP